MSGMERWQGRIAMVTGASSGIGAATARALAEAGLRVIACGRRMERLESLASEDTKGEIIPQAIDLRDMDAIPALFDEVRERWGGVDVLVNNAGLGHDAPLLTGSTAHWKEMLDVNVMALCVCTREAVADMRRRGDDGHVIHISSMAGHRVPAGSGMYSASKFAVRALTEGLRQELRHAGSRVRVTAVSPGFVETEFAAHFHQSEEKAAATYGRFPCLQPEDAASAVLYALSRPAHMAVHDVLMRPTEQML